MEDRFAAADTIIFLDLPRWRCLLNTLLRFLRYRGRVAPHMPPGCVERFDLEFYLWIWTFTRSHRPRLLGLIEKYRPDRRIAILRSRREIAGFLDDLPTTHGV
jgi:adenylate kinase family enzyme